MRRLVAMAIDGASDDVEGCNVRSRKWQEGVPTPRQVQKFKLRPA